MLTTLERTTGALEILVYLYIYGPINKSKFAKVLRHNHETVTRAIRILGELGLVKVEKELVFPFREMCGLTAHGRQLVQAPVYRWPALLWNWTGEGLLRPHRSHHGR
ncbi:MAG TPA: hypothetical protein VGR51_06060 [Thermoplasmata archaeon]|nr:hypothetical protein [Thermoplasmata archaeon]